MAFLRIRVSPGARSDEITGWLGETLKVCVKAPPERGKANDAVVALIADSLSIPVGRVSVERGAGSRDKLLRVDGITEKQLRARLAALG